MIDRVIGIDFSGAKDAGKRIWIAEAEIGDRELRITSCRAATELPGSGLRREQCLPALVAWIAGQGPVTAGCDFPFGLPATMIDAPSWKDFALGLGERYANAERFMADCRRRAKRRELKRGCDRAARVPFAAYNLRIYRQTFHGIRDFLAPLVRDHGARVVPMQRCSPRQLRIIETCPASTLKAARLYPSYKGKGAERHKARRAIVEGLTAIGLLPDLPAEIERVAIDNSGGDALDSIIAACATARCLKAGQFAEPVDGTGRIEGRVYF